MLTITKYKVSEAESKRWGTDWTLADQLAAWNNISTAEHVFKYLNRPYPPGVKPTDKVDVSGALPELLTIYQLAEKADITPEEALSRIHGSYDVIAEQDYFGVDEHENQLWYWPMVEKCLTEERLTENALADRFGLDRRTVKRHLNIAIDNDGMLLDPPMIHIEGKREYKLYWLSGAQEALNGVIN